MTESQQSGGPQRPPGDDGRVPSALLNWTSLTGMGLIALGFAAGLLTLLLDITSVQARAYTGVLFLVYLLLILVGLVVIPLGALRERRRRRPGGAPSLTGDLVIDLGRRSHRNALLVFMGIGAVAALAVTVGSYQTYQATESNLFCGQVCHSVMKPEATAYEYSSHARVQCVECHIGSGAGWYVRSKLSGVRQIFAVTLNTYPRPIPTPIRDLRPARETCEECHWPKKFIGFREVVRNYYLSDEESTPYRIRMLMKIGGEEHSLMQGAGIHYHMLLANEVAYIARDYERQDIAWVRIERDDGSVTIYEDEDEPLTAEEREELELRRMDCMDCHNRPSHKFPTPMSIVNQAIDVDAVSRELPFVKREAVFALDTDYETTAEAMEGIRASLVEYYADEHPEVLDEQSEELERTISELQRIYKRSVFPEMNASYKNYPDNIGHRDWTGCFRCHNDRLVSDEDETIFTTCNKCHLIIAQGEDVDTVRVDLTEGLPFQHPAYGGELIDEYTECTDCHTGGSLVYE